MKQLLLDIQPPPPASFENFTLGKNAEVVMNIKEAIHGNAPSRFIYLWGASGSGKTHLLKAAQAQGAEVADNVHLLNHQAQVGLFNHYNQIKTDGGCLICAGSHAPMQMGLREDLATRLAWGLVYQLQPLSDTEKATALQAHARERGINLPDEVIDYCLSNLRRDLPTLMTVLDALDTWSLVTKKRITVPMLKQLIQLDLSF
ncbi:MAG: DnaA/Hda family protein [Methylophilaceae bacterium]|jgi:DnaA-homolog protein|nr:DnaA/Hda family protein [Methylophilaceae bacterium]